MKKVTLKKKKPAAILWIGDNAECGEKWGRLWFSLELTDMKTGYIFINGSTNKAVTEKTKSKVKAKKLAEAWLRGKTK